MLNLLSFSFFSFASAGSKGFSSTIGVSAISSSSSLATFTACFFEDFDFEGVFFFSEVGVFGAFILSFGVVFGVLAGCN